MADSRICSIPDCGKKAFRRALCRTHYYLDKARPCSISGCTNPAANRGWCSAHYQRWRTYGDPHFRKAAANGEVMRYVETVVLQHASDECLFWPYARIPNGYPTIGGGGTTRYAHRVVCEQVHGLAPSPAYDAAHSCGNGHLACVNPRHLSWKTRTENFADCLIHGTRLRGSRQNGAKLTEDAVLTIRSLKGIRSQQELATQFGVSRKTISDIQIGRRWSWLFAEQASDGPHGG